VSGCVVLVATTCNGAVGVVVPIPTLNFLSYLIKVSITLDKLFSLKIRLLQLITPLTSNS